MIRHFATRIALSLGTLAVVASAHAQTPALTPVQREGREIFKELIEINSAHQTGSTKPVVAAIAKRFRAAGFPERDIHVIGPAGDKDPNIIVWIHGSSSALKPILLLAHLDVVEAKRADWSLDPYTFTEKDGFFYGRGTSDIKGGAATLISAMLRLKREHVTPKRTIIMALTAGEESGAGYNGVDWLVKNHRDLIDAELCLNVDGGDPQIKNGKRVLRAVQTSEKIYTSFRLDVTNRGGHSSLPPRENAIYRLAAALGRLSQFQFPVHLDETTRAFFERSAALESGQTAADMHAIAANASDSAVAARLSMSTYFNAQLRTTCVPTMLEGGHAPNALPQLARAIVNCRIVPSETPAETKATLLRVIADDSIHVVAMDAVPGAAASPLSPTVMEPLERVTKMLSPGVPIVPVMETGATDGAYLRPAGIPTYGVSGIYLDVEDIRAHGRDERIMVKEFYDGLEYIYQLVKAIGG
ncbi:MAG: M20/M25/M40 family metallo-hydrolase [Gemmatimonadota bacterium]|nr:M20/M25/M40 family metallo-hydrolase [Gemmatimonadota bacterium]